jgi:hypothetical protein
MEATYFFETSPTFRTVKSYERASTVRNDVDAICIIDNDGVGVALLE